MNPEKMAAWTTEAAITTADNVSLNANSTVAPDIIENKAVQAVFCTAYTIIFVLGIFGNVLVCYVVFRNKAMQTVTNLFITNLALSDVLLCLLAVPFTPLYTFLGRWVFGDMLCRIMPYAQGCSVYISTLTLTSIAIDRFFVIIYPFKPRMKIGTCLGLIVCIWSFSLLVTFPYGYYMTLHEIEGTSYCEETWPSDPIRKAFGAVTTTMQFVLPFIIMAFCYTCVSMRLNDRMKSRPGSKNCRKEDADRERKRRTNRMLIAMVAIFGLSWLPLNLINISSDFYNHTDVWKYNMLCFFIAHFIAMSSTCYNPFLYAWLNENFRKEFKQVLPCLSALAWGGRPARRQASERTDMYRSEKTCNGNDTIQESLLTSTVHGGVVYKGIEGAGTPSPAERAIEEETARTPEGGDCLNMYLLSENNMGACDRKPIVSEL